MSMNRIADNLTDCAHAINSQRAQLEKDLQHFEAICARIRDEISALDEMKADFGSVYRKTLSRQKMMTAAAGEQN